MEVLTAAQLVQALEEYAKSSEFVDVDEDFRSALKILEAQKINGKRFLKLDTIDFSHLGIPYGVGMDLKALSGPINADLLSTETPKDSTTEWEEEGDDRYSEIKTYFSAEDFDELSDYDKDVHLNLKRNYDEMCLKAPALNMLPPLPDFMKPKRQKTTKVRNKPEDPKPSCSKESSTGSCLKGPATSFDRILRPQTTNTTTNNVRNKPEDPKPSCSKESSTGSCLKGPATSFDRILRPQTTNTTANNVRDKPEDPKPSCSKEPPTGSCSQGPASSSFGHILRAQPTNSSTNNEAEEDSLSEDDVTEKPKAKAKPVKKMAEKDFISSLPSFDIDEIISKLKGRPIRDLEIEMKKDSSLASKHVKLLVRTLVLHLFCDREGNYKQNTTAHQKEGLAASIVMRCPFLKDDSDSTKWTWWRVYDRKLNRGRIPNVISNLQRKLDPEDKPSRNVVPSHSGSCADTSEEVGAGPSSSIDDFSWLGLLVPSAGEHKQILLGMNQSFPARKSWILSKKPTIHDVLDKFPHLVSYNGELIEEEFKLLYPKINHLALLQSFPLFISKLKGLETLPSLPDNLSDDVIQGCLWLASKMPWQNLKRFGKGKRDRLILEDLVQIIPSGINIRQAIEDKRKASQGPVQPYLICLIPEASISKMFAVVDNKTVEMNTSSFVKGLDILFKIYHAFNVNYPTGWSRFLSFLEWGFYKIDHKKLTNTMKDLITRIEG